uniref:Uncharacterized protein n=1 Tax=Porphyridium purpureum TaxID=35688 RepID=W0RYF1_PORPP|nr:hypothetical protein Y721_p214 [Porphyridium purpureum]BAO23594.1 hypothetical protein [Porphyridium purpureum]
MKHSLNLLEKYIFSYESLTKTQLKIFINTYFHEYLVNSCF